MTLTFPRDMTSAECWEEHAFTLVAPQELSRTVGGRLQARDLGPEVWRGVFRSYPLDEAEAAALHADFQTLRGSTRSFLATPPRKAPLADPDNSDTVTVDGVATNRDALALSGLTPGTVISAGDYVSIVNGADRDLYRFVRAATADGTGATPEAEVVPNVRAGITAGDGAAIVNPLVEMVLIPGSLDRPRVTRSRWRVVFEAIQVLR